MKKKKKNFLQQGPIPEDKLTKMVIAHQSKTDVGAHTFFLGQIREDEVSDAQVVAIEYSAYDEMANQLIYDIKEEAFERFDIRCLHIYHSLGRVNVGQISLLVMVSSAHRRASFEALEYLVEEIKKRVPIWKKELLSNGEHRWIGAKPEISA